jgi:hypothetical protein
LVGLTVCAAAQITATALQVAHVGEILVLYTSGIPADVTQSRWLHVSDLERSSGFHHYIRTKCTLPTLI